MPTRIIKPDIHVATSPKADSTSCEPEIYLSFCDGPDPRHTPELLYILRERNAKATFFVRGSLAARFPYLIKNMSRDGHAVGHIGWSGTPLRMLSNVAARKDLYRSTVTLGNILGYSPVLFLRPFAYGTDRLADCVQAMGQRAVDWDLRNSLWWPLDNAKRTALLLRKAQPGMAITLSVRPGLLRSSKPACLPVLNRSLHDLHLRGIRTAPLSCSS